MPVGFTQTLSALADFLSAHQLSAVTNMVTVSQRKWTQRTLASWMKQQTWRLKAVWMSKGQRKWTHQRKLILDETDCEQC